MNIAHTHSFCLQSTPLDLIETGKGLKFQAERPHLVSLGSGRLSTAITLLPLPEGTTPPAQFTDTHTHTLAWHTSEWSHWHRINHFPSWEARTKMLNWHNWEKLSHFVSFQGLYCIYSYVKLTSRNFWFHWFDLDGKGSTHGLICRDPTVRVPVHLSCLFICPRCWRLILWFCHWPLGPLLRLLIPVSDCLPWPACLLSFLFLSGWYAGRFPIRSHVLTGTRPLEGAGIVMAPGDLFLLQ